MTKARERAMDRRDKKLAKYGLTAAQLRTMSLDEVKKYVQKVLLPYRFWRGRVSPKDDIVSEYEIVAGYALRVKGMNFRDIEETMYWAERNGNNAQDIIRGKCTRTSGKSLWLSQLKRARNAVAENAVAAS